MSVNLLNAKVAAHLRSGVVHTGHLCVHEDPTFHQQDPPTCGFAVLREPDGTSGRSNYCILPSEVIEDLKFVGNDTAPPFPTFVPSRQCALQREAEAAAHFQRDKMVVGMSVSKTAQDLFNLFYKQLPKDTRWFSPGESEDIVVLGVRVKHPYRLPGSCQVLEPEGTKSLQRISNMVAKFLPLLN